MSDPDASKEVIDVPTEEQLRTAADTKPSLRSDEQQRWLSADSGSLSQAVRNKMHASAREERVHGAKK